MLLHNVKLQTAVNEFLIFLDLLSTLFFYQMNWNETRPFLEHCQFKCSWHILLTDCARSRRHARVVIPDHRNSLNENVNGPSRIVEFSPSVHTCIHFFFQFMKRVDFFFYFIIDVNSNKIFRFQLTFFQSNLMR